MKKWLSLLLSILMIVSIMPMSAVVANAEESSETTDEIVYTEVRTVEDLYMINFDLAGNYKLMNDIDLSVDTAEGGDWDYLGNGWDPIGSDGKYAGNAFTGIFDGNGYTISGLRIAVSTAPSGVSKTRYAGLFANNAGTIKNLTVSDDIDNTYNYGVLYTGSIAGYNSGIITNCVNESNNYTYKGSYDGSYDHYVGGIAGYSTGEITQCYNIGNISGENSYRYYECDVYVSGIACGSGTISNCYNTGTITATNTYDSDNAYAAGITSHTGSKKVSNCYNVGKAEKAISYGEVTNCYFLNGTGADVTGAKSLNDALSKRYEFYQGFDFNNTWYIDSNCEFPYPQLFSNKQVADSSPSAYYAPIEKDGYIEIRNVWDLNYINYELDGNYKLMNDIDLSVDTAEGGDWDYLGNGWDPIGSDGIYAGNKFTGIFDGNGYTISGLRIAVSTAPSGVSKTRYAGLFANNAGTIKNLTVSDDIDNTYNYGVLYTGSIAGYNSGIITNCVNESNNYTYKGSYDGSYDHYVGGIAGYSTGEITQCYNIGNISGENSYRYYECDVYVSGIACGSGTISNCYNTGTITATNTYDSDNAYAAGITYNTGSKNVSNCYNIGTAEKAISYGEVTNCYFLNGTGADVTGAKSLTAAQMKMQAMYAGFDFENVWFIDRASEYVYPQIINNRQVPVPEAEVTKVEFAPAPSKVEYELGDAIDLTGGKLAVYYSDDTVEYVDINENMVSVKTFTYAGEQDVKVYYGDFELSYTVNVIKVAKIVSLEMATMPDKTDFVQNTAFDFTGATALATYDDGTTKIVEITDKNTTGGDINKTGKYTITVEFEGKTTQFEVSVVLLRIIGIEITTLPSKTTYVLGEELDTIDMVVSVVYNSGKKVATNDYTVSELDDTVGYQTVTVTYMVFTKTFSVNVLEKPRNMIGIMVMSPPDKQTYYVGEELDTTGLVVSAVYDNGDIENISDYEVSGFDNEKTGEQIIKVTYDKFTTTFEVEVSELSSYILGDVNGDGEVDVMDATLIQRKTAMLACAIFDVLAADVDGNGSIDVMDATLIQRYVAMFKIPYDIGKVVTK